MEYDEILKLRAITTDAATCGYANGDPSKVRTANSGYDCRIDTVQALWGFCPTSVSSASDCGLAAACSDQHACSGICGKTGVTRLTTFTCSLPGASYCSTVLLDSGPDLTFSYIACGTAARTETLLANPTSAKTTASSSSKTSPSNSKSTSSASDSSSSSLSTASPAAQTSSSGGSSGSTTGTIAGGVIGGLALVCLTVVAVVLVLRGSLRKHRENNELAAAAGVEPSYDNHRQQMSNNEASWSPSYYAPAHQTYPVEMYVDPAAQRLTEPAELAVPAAEFRSPRSELDGSAVGRP
ncbi:hypothetical protein JX265_011914 [Neoarthrinium moseri]|uniref:Uncharacterized protein n=1 Tax=Neoarthrinium moseri TaxID=1658444 RepID=A0A9P9WBR9_9PEZI|nr:hypothetical protein JX265_011914 [Neoarthrinium moseri]